MDKNILTNILQLDTIFRVLTWKDRIRIHLLLQDKIETASPQIIKLAEWLEQFKWLPPNMRYGQDRLLYYENAPGEWRPIEELKNIDLQLPKLI